MHVDEKKIKSDNLLNSVKVVLVGTTHPGNIGATARAMKNMGILDLALVEPKEFPSDVATFRSKAAKDILEKASVHRSLAEAVSECELVVGTVQRRTVPWPVLNPREAAEEMHKSSRNGKVAIVFGREDRGLTNEELGLCNFHVHIPSDPEYSSLNLSQAVQILAYEIRLSYLKDQHVNKDYWDVELANNEQTERLINHMDELMQEVDFYDVENPRKLLVRVRRFFKRSKIDVMEVNIFRGLFATIQKKLK